MSLGSRKKLVSDPGRDRMNETNKTIEEKEGRVVASLPSPLSIGQMNNNQEMSEVQAHLNQFFSQLASCPELEGQLGAADLP